jgi:TPR repeat protein/Flp pilus assembly protein TadD
MKCLEKDRTRRYETASGLAMDVQRHLDNEPVVARPPSKLYEFQKTVKRHKIGFAAAGAVIMALAIGLGIATWTLVKEKRARERADNAEQEQKRQRQIAESKEKKSQEVAEFLKDMLKGVGPSAALGRDTKMLRDVLDRTAERLRELEGQPEIEADLLATLGNVYYDLGDYAKARGMHSEALSLRKKLHASDHPDVADSLNDFAQVLYGEGKYLEAAAIHREALAMRRKLFGNEHHDVAASLNNLAETLRRNGQTTIPEAEPLFRQALAMRRKLLGNEHVEVAESLHNLGSLIRNQSHYAEAETMLREALAIRRRLLGNEHPDIATTLDRLALALKDQAKYAEAEPIARESLAMRRKLFGPEHPDLAHSLHNLAMLLGSRNKLAEAEELEKEALGIRRKLFDHKNPDLATSFNNLYWHLRHQSKLEEAKALAREAKRLGIDAASDDDPHGLSLLYVRLESQGKTDEAEALSRHLDETKDIAAIHRIGWRYETGTGAPKNYFEAIKWYRKSLELGSFNSAMNLAYLYQGGRGVPRDYAEVERLYRKAIAIGGTNIGSAWNGLAWLLATCPDPKVRNGSNALIYAEMAVTSLRNGNHLDTLAAASAEAGDFSRAVTLMHEAISLEPNRAGWYSHLKLFESRMPFRQFPAEEGTNKTFQSAALRAQAIREAGLGQWKEASATFAKVVELQPDEPLRSYQLAMCLAQSGDLAGYQKHCEAMLMKFSGTTNASIARMLLKGSLIMPVAKTDSVAMKRLIDTAITQTNDWTESVLALVEYRQGRFADAATSANHALAKPPLERRDAQASLVLAMARRGLNQTDEARLALAKGSAIVHEKAQKIGEGTDYEWPDWIISQFLLREARSLIEPGATPIREQNE